MSRSAELASIAAISDNGARHEPFSHLIPSKRPTIDVARTLYGVFITTSPMIDQRQSLFHLPSFRPSFLSFAGRLHDVLAAYTPIVAALG